MIKTTETILDPPFQFKKKLDNILFSVNNYSCETLEAIGPAKKPMDGSLYTNQDNLIQDNLIQNDPKLLPNNKIISRNIDFTVNKPKKLFNYLTNDCIEEKKTEEPINYKYNRIILEKNYGGDDGEAQDEDIDTMIQNIKYSIKKINQNIVSKKKNTLILNSTIFRNYKSIVSEQQFLNEKYEALEITEFLRQCNEELNDFNELDDLIMIDEFLKGI